MIRDVYRHGSQHLRVFSEYMRTVRAAKEDFTENRTQVFEPHMQAYATTGF